MREFEPKETETPALPPPHSIAIIGMSGRFPKSADLAEFWANLVAGCDCVSHFSVEDLIEAGHNPATLSNPKYVRSKGVLDHSLAFDAPLFGFSPREVEIIDPQQRIFIECAMAALEDAGCDPERFDGSIGVYAGQSLSTYMLNLLLDPRNAELQGSQIVVGNDKDFLASRTSYKLNLKGPSVSVQSACSTSLVAVALACQNLLDYACDVALAGGVCVTFPQKEGYLYEEGGTHSPDGYCRTFDSRPSGLVGGNGVGVIVLKRLEDALADRDYIHAVIRSAASNNDGSLKVGFSAPSVDGQAEAVSLALALADVDPETIRYVEAHGTATRLGDPIEVAALTKAFRRKTAKTGYCGIGSVKTNIGHLDAAAGVAGLIKTVLTIQNGVIPPTLHVETLNPQIEFSTSPFYVCKQATPWPKDPFARRASVSSFGIGGTNAHVILEEAPPVSLRPDETPRLSILTLSANSGAALKQASNRMAAFLRANPGINLADAAYSLQLGRKAWKHRLAVVCEDAAKAATLIEGGSGVGVARGQSPSAAAPIYFLFPGQGAQYVGMMRGLYDTEPCFKTALDHCADLLQPEIGRDLRHVIFADTGDAAAATELDQTRTTQPALFAVEYALARLWMSWGVEPNGMLGHSIGEYVAACLAGVMELSDALRLVSRRGALMQSLPSGGMASIPLPYDEVEPLLDGSLSLAAILGPRLCVVAGAVPELAALGTRLAAYSVGIKLIRTSHAFHSRDMAPILDRFVEAFAGVTLHPPRIPFVSNVTGTWITPQEAVDPSYWARQLREMVRLHDGLATLGAAAHVVCVEVGPGRSLSALSQHAIEGRRMEAVPSCCDRDEAADDRAAFVGALARLWTLGASIDWHTVSNGDIRRKVPLPTYPFEREDYSLLHVGPPQNGPAQEGMRLAQPVSDLLFAPVWRRAPLAPMAAIKAGTPWLLFLDGQGLGARCAKRLRELGHRVVTVGVEGEAPSGAADHRLVPDESEGYVALFRALAAHDLSPERILHFWSVEPGGPGRSMREKLQLARAKSFDSLLYIAQALGAREAAKPCLIAVASTGLHDVIDDEVEPEKSLLIGPCRVIPVEYPTLAFRSIDLLATDIETRPDLVVAGLIAEASQAGSADSALRRGLRWTRTFEAMHFNPHGDPPPDLPSILRRNGAYLITGGLGGIGLSLAGYLAAKVGARLILTGRNLPPNGGQEQMVALENAGAEVLILQADVTDRSAMAEALAQAKARFGDIHGVIHAAGIAGRGIMQRKTVAEVDRVLAPKVEGTLVLHELLEGTPLDFFAACSSISTIVGSPGQADYTSANAFQDAFAHAHRQSDVRYLAIDWDRWDEVGMAVNEMANQPYQAEMQSWMQGLQPAQGAEAFDLALASIGSQIAVALGNFEWISRYGPPRQREGPQAVNSGERRSYRRPDIETTFESPTNEIEGKVADLFQDVLGIKDAGIDDNFFDLGGHSLLGVRLLVRIQEVFGVDIGIGELFSLPTIRSLSRTIESRTGRSAGAFDATALGETPA